MGECLVSKTVGCPRNGSTGGDRVNVRLQNIPQSTAGKVGPAEMYGGSIGFGAQARVLRSRWVGLTVSLIGVRLQGHGRVGILCFTRSRISG